MAKDLAIVLNSGGINSAVAAAMAAQKSRVVMVHIEGPTLSSDRKRAAHDAQVAAVKPFREHVLALPYLEQLSTPDTPGMGGDQKQSAITAAMNAWLPLLSAAARVADMYNATRIYAGFRVGGQGDALAQATEYVQIWNELLQMPCGHAELEIDAPLLELKPAQVIDLAFNVAAPLDKTWSCDADGDSPCWACAGCRARELAFSQAAKIDPLRAVRKA